MADMLVRLYSLPEVDEKQKALEEDGIVVKRVQPWERSPLRRFIEDHFSEGWADEAETALVNKPITCFVAQDGDRMVGFAAYECTRRDFFGPMGVDEAYRKRGIGAVLTLKCLHAMYEMGYGYAIIGAAGPTGFYEKCCGAEIIEDSKPGIYQGTKAHYPPPGDEA
ncbi:MAG: GNAT family N-acetyltransferase [Armatimonadia bacterium]|nr:GNAT family N-acetyltransferase [Armatimonadia bacterium]